MGSTLHPLYFHPFLPKAFARMESASLLFYFHPSKTICIDGECSPSILSLYLQRICIDRKHFSPKKMFLSPSNLIHRGIKNLKVWN
jgi:hypothetical protein